MFAMVHLLSDINLHTFAVFAFIDIHDQRRVIDCGRCRGDRLKDIIHIGMTKSIDVMTEITQEPTCQSNGKREA